MPRTATHPAALFLAGLVLLAPLLAAGCGTTRAPAQKRGYPAVRSSEFGSMSNVSVSGELWFGSVPSAADLDLARRRGIQRVVDLRTPDEPAGEWEGRDELAAACAALGIELVDLHLAGTDAVEAAAVDAALAEMAREEAGPLLLFCGTGSRCATLFAVHRVVQQGVPLESALHEARRAGMPAGGEAFVRQQVDRLASGPDGEPYDGP